MKIRRACRDRTISLKCAFGDTPHLRYWDFLPTRKKGWGHMPAWASPRWQKSTVEGAFEKGDVLWLLAHRSHLVVKPCVLASALL